MSSKLGSLRALSHGDARRGRTLLPDPARGLQRLDARGAHRDAPWEGSEPDPAQRPRPDRTDAGHRPRTGDTQLALSVVEFDAEACEGCSLRVQSQRPTPGTGRTISIAEGQVLQQRLRRRMKTGRGRERLRERVAIEHSLAHNSQRQGNPARYRGTRENQYDLRRAATIQNLERTQRRIDERKAA